MSVPYMRWYPADYLADTMHLTTLEHGAYTLLLWAMWRAGGSLPANDKKLAQITLMPADDWLVIKPKVLDLFRHRGGSLRHKRVTRELEAYRAHVKASKLGGEASARKRAEKTKTSPPGADELPLKGGSTNQNQNQNQNQKEEPPTDVGGAHARKTRRCPSTWTPGPTVFALAVAEHLASDVVERELMKLRNHEFAHPRSDWDAVARNWLMKSAETAKVNGHDHQRTIQLEKLARVDAAMRAAAGG